VALGHVFQQHEEVRPAGRGPIPAWAVAQESRAYEDVDVVAGGAPRQVEFLGDLLHRPRPAAENEDCDPRVVEYGSRDLSGGTLLNHLRSIGPTGRRRDLRTSECNRVRDDPAIELVARNIRRLREDRNLSQVELARRAGVDLRTITRIESVQREPGVSTLARIARGLGVPPAELWRDVT
jgi:DNA-binding XRE family transcriptional regulator